MKNRISSIMTTSKKRRTLWGIVSAVALVSILTVGTIVAFAANNNGYREFDPNYTPDPVFYVPAISSRPDHLYIPAIPADEDDLPQFDYDLPKAEEYEIPDLAFLDVYEMRTLVETGAVASDELPPFALWTHEELLDELSHYVALETRHHEMSRDELVARVSRVRVLQRLEIAVDQDTNAEFFEWVRENYTEQDIAIYVELGASQQLVDRLRAEIAMR